MNFPQQRHFQCFLFRVRSHNYVYLIILLTQEEEHNQLFCKLSVEFLVRLIHFVHFMHPYMNPLPLDLVRQSFHYISLKRHSQPCSVMEKENEDFLRPNWELCLSVIRNLQTKLRRFLNDDILQQCFFLF